MAMEALQPDCRPRKTGVLRPGLPSDFDAVKAILKEANLSAPSPGDVERVTHAQIGEILTLVYERKQEVVAVLQWRNLLSEAEILDLAVKVAHRRQGLATVLLGSFLKQAARSGTRQVFLEVRESNLAALGLYRNFGFEIAGRRPDYYRCPQEAALIMRLGLEG